MWLNGVWRGYVCTCGGGGGGVFMQLSKQYPSLCCEQKKFHVCLSFLLDMFCKVVKCYLSSRKFPYKFSLPSDIFHVARIILVFQSQVRNVFGLVAPNMTQQMLVGYFFSEIIFLGIRILK